MKIPAYDPADGPPVLMLNVWVSHLHQRLIGYREPLALFGSHQRTVKRRLAEIRPKNLENLNFKDLTIPPKLITELIQFRLDIIKRQTTNRSYHEPFAETKARIEQSAPPLGFISAFFSMLPDLPNTLLPHTQRRAEEIDRLAHALLAQQLDGSNGSIAGFKRTLIESPLVARDYWVTPDTNVDFLPLFEQTEDRTIVWKITNLVIFYQQIAFIALWDIEYCNNCLGSGENIPLFLQLAPRIRRKNTSNFSSLIRVNTRQNDIIDNPFSLLLDLFWCVIKRCQDKFWPERFPSDAEMRLTFNSYSGNLAQLRAGRPNLTILYFSGLWPDNVRNIDGEVIGPPITLLAIAHLWNIIIPTRKLIPVDEIYMRAWRHAKELVGTQVDQETATKIAWPEYLNRGLDSPAPS